MAWDAPSSTYSADEVGVHHLHQEPHSRWLILHHERLALGRREGVRSAVGCWGSLPSWVLPLQLTLPVKGVGSSSQPFSSMSLSSASVSFFSSSLSK